MIKHFCIIITISLFGSALHCMSYSGIKLFQLQQYHYVTALWKMYQESDKSSESISYPRYTEEEMRAIISRRSAGSYLIMNDSQIPSHISGILLFNTKTSFISVAVNP